MDDENLVKLFHSGKMYKIFLTDEAEETLKTLQRQHESAHKGWFASLFGLIKRYGDTGTLHAPKQVNDEGDGFFAIKQWHGLRAYCWKQHNAELKEVILISHCMFKTRQKLSKSDKTKMLAIRERYSSGFKENDNE